MADAYYLKITDEEYNNLKMWLGTENELVLDFSYTFPDIPSAQGYHYAFRTAISDQEFDYLDDNFIVPEPAVFGISTTPSFVAP